MRSHNNKKGKNDRHFVFSIFCEYLKNHHFFDEKSRHFLEREKYVRYIAAKDPFQISLKPEQFH